MIEFVDLRRAAVSGGRQVIRVRRGKRVEPGLSMWADSGPEADRLRGMHGQAEERVPGGTGPALQSVPRLCGSRGADVVRWIAFDDDTAEAVICRLRRGAAYIQHMDPLDAALENPQSSLVVLPSRVAGRLLVAHFSARAPLAVPVPGSSPPKIPPRSTAEKKAWWRKLVA